MDLDLVVGNWYVFHLESETTLTAKVECIGASCAGPSLYLTWDDPDGEDAELELIDGVLYLTANENDSEEVVRIEPR